MAAADESPKDRHTSSQQRSAETRKIRSRAALLRAAHARFSEQGWLGTRMEDVARDAGLSAATAYNHFSTKHTLIGSVFAPIFTPCLERGYGDMHADPDTLEVLERHLRDISEVLHENFRLTKPFLEGVWDALVRFGADHIAPDDPRMLVPLPAVVLDLVSHGQRVGIFDRTHTPLDAAAYIVNCLTLQVLCQPEASPDHTADLVIKTARGVLRPR